MPGNPFALGIIVNDTDGSTPLENVRVSVRNERTNEISELDTNSSGETIFQLANASVWTSGWRIGDICSYFTIYKAYEAEGSFTLTDVGGAQKTLNLEVRAVAAILRYFAPQDFLDTFQLVQYDSDPHNGLKPETIAMIGESIEAHIDRKTRRRWDSNNGNYETITQELHNSATNVPSAWPYDIDIGYTGFKQVYHTRKGPIFELTTFQVNRAAPSSDPNWTTITEAANQITVRKNLGRIRIVRSDVYPVSGDDQVRITYKVGETTVPADIRRLAILLTAKAMAGDSLQGINITKTEVEGLNSAIQNLGNMNQEIKELWKDRVFFESRGV